VYLPLELTEGHLLFFLAGAQSGQLLLELLKLFDNLLTGQGGLRGKGVRCSDETVILFDRRGKPRGARGSGSYARKLRRLAAVGM